MAIIHRDSQGGVHFSAEDAQRADWRYAEETQRVQRDQLVVGMIAAEESTRLREEQERQNARQQSHNQEMERLEAARLEAQSRQIQYQKDVACLQDEPVAVRAQYLIKRALENAPMPFDTESFDRHLNEMFSVMAQSRLDDLQVQAARARTARQTAWQEVCMRSAEAAALEPDVQRTRPGNPFKALVWSLGALGCLFVVCLILSLAHDGGLLPALFFTGCFAAICSPIVLVVTILELSRLPKAKRAHQQAQQELVTALEQKSTVQEAEATWKAEVEKVEHQITEETGHLNAKLIEYLRTRNYQEFIRAQHPLTGFTEFVWLQVKQVQEELPPRCKVAREDITVGMCGAYYPVLLEQAVSKSIKRVKSGRLGEKAHAAKHDDGFAVTLDEC